MIKKAVLMVFATMLIVFGASVAFANQTDGMISGAAGTLSLPEIVAADPINISVNPGGQGDALIYGYYNTRDSFNLIRVVNTSVTTAVKARVRFREGKHSKEILDFNICLSNKDQWTAWVYSPAAGGPAVILPADTDTVTAPTFAGAQPFKYSATGPAGLSDVTASDTEEGYFEIIASEGKGGGSETIDVTWTSAECTNAIAVHVDAPNSLIGNSYIFVFGAQGVGSYSYNATALADCDVLVDAGLTNEAINLVACAEGLSAVDYVLTKQNHYAMFEVEDWLAAETEVIINFPTKIHHLVTAYTAYSKPFDTDTTTDCEPVLINTYNDQEDTTTSTTDFSPTGPGATPELCWEVNVIKINTSDIMNSDISSSLTVTGVTPYTGLGWVRVGLDHDNATATCLVGNSTCYGTAVARESVGLPSIGYVLNGYFGAMGGMDSTQYNSLIR